MGKSSNIDESIPELIGEELNNTLQNKSEFKDFIKLIKQNIGFTQNADSYFRDQYIAELTLNFDKELIKELLEFDESLSLNFKKNLKEYL